MESKQLSSAELVERVGILISGKAPNGNCQAFEENTQILTSHLHGKLQSIYKPRKNSSKEDYARRFIGMLPRESKLLLFQCGCEMGLENWVSSFLYTENPENRRDLLLACGAFGLQRAIIYGHEQTVRDIFRIADPDIRAKMITAENALALQIPPEKRDAMADIMLGDEVGIGRENIDRVFGDDFYKQVEDFFAVRKGTHVYIGKRILSEKEAQEHCSAEAQRTCKEIRNAIARFKVRHDWKRVQQAPVEERDVLTAVLRNQHPTIFGEYVESGAENKGQNGQKAVVRPQPF